jgi:hypothetical protein
LLARPLRGRRQKFVFLGDAEPSRQELHFLSAADFLTGDAIDRYSYAVEDDDRTLSVLQDRPILPVGCSPASKSKSSRASRRQLTWPLLL